MLIRLLGALTQTNEWVGKLQTLVRDPLGQFVFVMAKYYILYGRFLFKLLFLETASCFRGTIMLISKIGTLTQSSMG